jgi:hypothetical protein
MPIYIPLNLIIQFHFTQSTNTWWLREASIEVFTTEILFKPWNDRFGILPLSQNGVTWLVDHCTSLSLFTLHYWCHFKTDNCPSFLRRSFCACLIKFVTGAGLFCALWELRAIFNYHWWVHFYASCSSKDKKLPREFDRIVYM